MSHPQPTTGLNVAATPNMFRAQMQAVTVDEVSTKLTAQGAEVIQLYRYPGLSSSGATTLLHKVSYGGSVDMPLCILIKVSAQLLECGCQSYNLGVPCASYAVFLREADIL